MKTSGEYFRPECARWTKVANQAAPGSGREAVSRLLAEELRAALARLVYVRSSRMRLVDDLREKILNG